MMSNNDEEHFERIPWDQLRSASGNRRGLVYALAAAIVAAAVSAMLARNLGEPSGPTVLQALAETVPSTVAIPSTTSPAAPSTTVESPVVWSEADLMAVHPDELKVEATAVAEWFVADYFTADGAGELEAQLRSMLPTDVPLPVHDPGYRSFVEWTRATSAVESAPGEYVVSVMVRALGAAADAGYQRLPLRAVEVMVRWTDAGWSIADLPSPIDLPQLASSEPWPQETLPEEVANEALELAGEGSTVIGGGKSGEGWRVVVEMIDSTGGRWPMVVWVDETAPSG